VLLISSFSLQKTNADIAPTPYIVVFVKGVEVDYYYLDLLVDISEDDPGTTYYPNPLDDLNNEQILEVEALRDYEDPDGYQLALLDGTSTMMAGSLIGEEQSNGFYLHFFAYGIPERYKIIILTCDGDILVSEIVNRTLFQSQTTYDLTDFSIQEGEVNWIPDESNDYILTDVVPTEEVPLKETISAFILRVVITVIVELGLAYFIFKFRTRKLIEIIIGVNIITQLILNIVMFTSWDKFEILQLFIGIEVFVFLFEYISYYLLFKEESKLKILLYVFVANLATLGLGLIIGI
jgi:hypothetical protein